jgi:hypothetical protein
LLFLVKMGPLYKCPLLQLLLPRILWARFESKHRTGIHRPDKNDGNSRMTDRLHGRRVRHINTLKAAFL